MESTEKSLPSSVLRPDVEMTPSASIRGRGLDLNTAWAKDEEFGILYTYTGLATPGYLNLFYIWGPR